MRLESDALRSWSQKNLASESRARSTRSLPATIALPLSLVTMLATTMKFGASAPARSVSAKYFWCERIEVMRTSGGTSMKASSMAPLRTTGHSTRPVTSSSSAGVIAQVETGFLGERGSVLLDLGAARGRIEQNAGVFELGLVVGEVLDGDRAVAEEAVAEGSVMKLKRRKALAAQVEGARQRRAVEHCHDTMQRAHPPERRIRPAHGLRPGQTGENRAEHAFDRPIGWPAFLCRNNKPELVALYLAFLALVERGQAGRFEEALDRLVGRANARALALLGDVGLLGRDAVDHQGQAARRDVGLRALKIEPGLLQPVGDQTLQVVGRAGLHARRDLFGEQFKEELSHGARPRPTCPNRHSRASGNPCLPPHGPPLSRG